MKEFFKHFWLSPLHMALIAIFTLCVATYADPGKQVAEEITKCRAENLH